MKKILFLLLALMLLSCNKTKTIDQPKVESEKVEEIRNRDMHVDKEGVYETSKGYTSDENYEPTVTEKGEYSTIDGKRKQVQYQGSKEQKEHLDEMKKRGW